MIKENRILHEIKENYNQIAEYYEMNSLLTISVDSLEKYLDECYAKDIDNRLIEYIESLNIALMNYFIDGIKNSSFHLNLLVRKNEKIKQTFPHIFVVEKPSISKQKEQDRSQYSYTPEVMKKELPEQASIKVSERVQTPIQVRSQTKAAMKTNHLLSLLQTLSDASKEAIMGPDTYSGVRDYLHIDTPIQKKLQEALENNVTNGGSQLIVLCGNVGDGKSHLIAHLKSHSPHLFAGVDVYNDATESMSPEKTAVETLETQLASFDDDHLFSSDKKMVLAINIGVLNNFITAMEEKGKFGMFRQFITQSSLYKSKGVITDANGKFQVISFFDYPLIRLDGNKVQSDFYDALFERLFQKDDVNIFYKAYKADKAGNNEFQCNYNYELLLNEKIQETLKSMLYRTIVQDKLIISTRKLLNFIYNTIVPGKEVEGKHAGFLPFLLFENPNHSEISSSMRRSDPVRAQHSGMDKVNIEYYNTNNYLTKTKELIGEPPVFEQFALIFNNLDRLPRNEQFHQITVNTFVRLMYLIQHSDWNLEEEVYQDFLDVVYAVETKNRRALNDFIRMVMDSVREWNNSPRNNYIFLEEKSDSDIAIGINYTLEFISIEKNAGNYGVKLTFEEINNGTEHSVAIDFNLYSLLRKLKAGYVLKESDKRQGINFKEFLDSLIHKTKSLRRTIVVDKKLNYVYELRNNGLGYEVTREKE